MVRVSAYEALKNLVAEHADAGKRYIVDQGICAPESICSCGLEFSTVRSLAKHQDEMIQDGIVQALVSMKFLP